MTKQRDPYSSKDILEPVYRRIAELQRRVDSLENKSIPTVPFYDPLDYPQDSVEGQVAVGTDDVHRWFSHGEWHRAEPVMPWVLFQTSLAGVTIPGGGVLNDHFFDISGLLTSPLNGGGRIDENVFGGITLADAEVDIETGGSSNEPFKAIKFRSTGLFFCMASLGWFTDWGPIRFNYNTTHDDSDFSFFVHDVFLMRTDNTMINAQGTTLLVHNPTTAHNQYAVQFCIAFHIDERCVNPRIRFSAVSDVSRTWGSTPFVDVGGMGVFIVRLSPSGDSKP